VWGVPDPALGPRRHRRGRAGIPTNVSLAVIIGILVVVTVASLLKTRRDPTATAHAGSLRGARAKSSQTEQSR
jgi:hypothetical protein